MLKVGSAFFDNLLPPSFDGLPSDAVRSLDEQKNVRSIRVGKRHQFLWNARVRELGWDGRQCVVGWCPWQVRQLLLQ